MPPLRHRLATLLSIAGLLAAAPLVWLVAIVIAPSVLTTPVSHRLQLVPVALRARTADAPPGPADRTVAPQHAPIPEPIAERWRTAPDGRLVFPMDSTASTSTHDPRRNAP